MKKTLRKVLPVLALVLVVAVASVGGTIAWLTASTTPVTNTFTVGDINITLMETTGDSYKIIPGTDLTKDPKVTVRAGSEACWLFVKVEEANWPDAEENDGTRKVKYEIAGGWTLVDGQTNVYYRELSATTADTDFYVLKDNKVTVSANLTKTEAGRIVTKNEQGEITVQPKLTFTAYAIQKEHFETPEAAWTEVSK